MALPRQSILANARRLVIPYGLSVSGNLLRKDITVMKFDPNLGLPFEYREVRFHSISVY